MQKEFKLEKKDADIRLAVKHFIDNSFLLKAPSTAISWSVYEGAKYMLRSSGNDGSDPDDYETLQSVMKDASASGQIGSRVGHLSPGKDAAEESVRHLVVVGTPKVAAAASQ